MSDLIHYDKPAIAELGNQTVKASQQFEANQHDLRSLIAPVQADLRGRFAEAYEHAQVQWNTAADDLKNILNDIGNRVNSALENMTDTDNSAAKAWG